MRFSVRPSAQNALFRHAAAPGMCEATARQAAGHYGKWPNWANALEQPPASLLGGLCQGPQISVWSLDSRKSALCPTCGLQNAPFGDAATADCAFPLCSTCRLRFFVRRRHVCPGEEKRILRKDAFWRWALTEKRTLRSVSHGKAHPACEPVTKVPNHPPPRAQDLPPPDIS